MRESRAAKFAELCAWARPYLVAAHAQLARETARTRSGVRMPKRIGAQPLADLAMTLTPARNGQIITAAMARNYLAEIANSRF
jgi:hypothetical protein